MTLEQGDLRPLESDTAKRLLSSTTPARYAYTGLDGTPRIVASWFVWTGDVRTLRANPDVVVSIDTEAWPPEVLSLRGRAEVTEIWVGLLDFQSRMPSALGGTQP